MPSAPREMNTVPRPVSSSFRAAWAASSRVRMDMLDSSSASRRLGFRAANFPSTGRSFSALMVDTGSARMGALQLSHSHRMDSSGRLVSSTTRSAPLMKSSRCRRKSGVMRS